MPPNNLQRVTINDFRAGIVSNTRGSTTGFLDLPPGSAVEAIDCIANSTGQLVPLPLGSRYGTVITPSAHTGTPFISGIAATGPTQFTGEGTVLTDMVHLFLNFTSNAPLEQLAWWIKKGSGPTNVNITTLNGNLNVGQSNRGITKAITRGRRSTFSSPGFPIIAIEWTSQSATGLPNTDGAFANYAVYPDPNALAVDTPFVQTATVNNAAFALGGQILAHSGRILRLCEFVTGSGLSNLFVSNERVRYTDPPNSIDLSGTTTDSILDPQYAGGYGAWGSISFGELLLVKRYGGALLVEGDIYAPQITRLPGVQSTGTVISEMAQCSSGLVYMTEDGAYMWNGGNNSQRLNSPAVLAGPGGNAPGPLAPTLSGINASVCAWNNYVVFSAGAALTNTLYDPINNSWWLMSSPGGTIAPQWFAASPTDTQVLYGVSTSLNSLGNVEMYKWDTTTSVSSYSWTSQTIPISMSNQIDVQEVELVMSSMNAATNTVTIQFVDSTGALITAETFTLPGTRLLPLRLRKPIGFKASDIRLQILVSSTGGSAPITNSISIGYNETGPFPQAV